MWIATIDFTKASTPSHTNQFGKHSISAVLITSTSAPSRRFTKKQKASVQTDVESNMFGIKKGTKQGDSVKLAVQHSSTESTERNHSALAKEKRNGNLLERRRSRLPHKFEVRRRRATVRNIQRTASKNDVRIQGKY